MEETSSATPHAWSLPAHGIQPRLQNHRSGKSNRIHTDEVDIERAVVLWGDTVLRFALCRTKNIADAEDVTQTVFLRLCQNRPAIESDEHLKAWLLRTAFCCSIDMHRNPWKKHRTDAECTQEMIEQASLSNGKGTDCYSGHVQNESLVDEAVASLPERQRIVVHLRYFEGYSTQEIAEITGENPSTVRSHLHRARATLKTMMGGINE